jgi:hypothetical protein
VVRDGKGMESRVTMLPASLIEDLRFHLQLVKRTHQQDLEKGYGSVYLPFALERKYKNADRDWVWQYVFPSDRISSDPRSAIADLVGWVEHRETQQKPQIIALNWFIDRKSARSGGISLYDID